MIGRLLGNRYELLEKLGGGGMALVYKGRDTFLNRLVTVKILRPEYISDEDFIRRFRREAQAVASLSHPNIVSIYDVGQEDDTHYLVMEYINGDNLKNIIKQQGFLPPAQAVQIARQIAEALEHAHDNNIVHRDVKPHNILITTGGKAKLTDFGIAQATAATYTQTDTIVGSVHYLSPEQAKGEMGTPKSDIYSLGVVLYEMLTGTVPFQANGPVALALKHIQEAPVPPSKIKNIPPDLEKVVMRAMEKNPDRRYKSARSFGDDLAGTLQGGISDETRALPVIEAEEYTRVIPTSRIREEVAAQSRPTARKAQKRRRPKPLAWVLLALLVVALIGGGIYALNSYVNIAEVTTPNVVGLTTSAAKAKLAKSGLTSVHTTTSYDPQHAKGTVISQDPQPEEKVKKIRTVNLVISMGTQMLTVPSLVNIPYDEARIDLTNQGFVVSRQDVYSNSIKSGFVADQSPQGETSQAKGSQVILYVSKGPEPVQQQVPDLTGQTQDQAMSTLSKVGLTLDSNITQAGSSQYMTGQIIDQDPKPNTSVQQGTAVKITISTGPGPAAKTVKVTVNVPNDGKQHEVRIMLKDQQGEREVYINTQQPGDNFVKQYTYYGNGTVTVYIDGNAQQTQSLN